jgi:hypothetical protein
MRADLNELMDKLGVGYILSPYETCPWSAHDPESGVTASAEVRMDNEGREIEAELQFLYDDPEPGKPPMEQMIWIFAKPVVQAKWSPLMLRIKGQDEPSDVYEWEAKGCNLFNAAVQEIKMGNVPDIDDLIEREMGGDERFRDSRRGGGSKAPKIKPQALLGLKNGRGF